MQKLNRWIVPALFIVDMPEDTADAADHEACEQAETTNRGRRHLEDTLMPGLKTRVRLVLDELRPTIKVSEVEQADYTCLPCSYPAQAQEGPALKPQAPALPVSMPWEGEDSGKMLLSVSEGALEVISEAIENCRLKALSVCLSCPSLGKEALAHANALVDILQGLKDARETLSNNAKNNETKARP